MLASPFSNGLASLDHICASIGIATGRASGLFDSAMRANIERGRRLAFDSVADIYDAGRPRFDDSIVADILLHAHLSPGDVVLEIGAGTGQLTEGLLRAGLKVTALEPGHNMALRLQSLAEAGSVTVIETLFEEFEPPEAYAAVIAANAFHWLDPKISYRKAHQIVQPGGCLCLLWNYPALADTAFQRELNDKVFFGELAHLRHEPEGYKDLIDKLLSEGREELRNHSSFNDVWWVLCNQRLSLCSVEYLNLLSSYPSVTGPYDTLASRLFDLIPPYRKLELDNYVYLCVAREQ